MVVRYISPKASYKWGLPNNSRFVRGFQPAAASTPQARTAKDSRDRNQMMLAFFWSVADCNRYGCAVQWDALCNYPNHKKTQKKRKRRKEIDTGNMQYQCVCHKKKEVNPKKIWRQKHRERNKEWKKERERERERERKRERERERERICLCCHLCSFTLPSVPRCFVRSVARACSYKRLANIFEAVFLPPPTFLHRSNKKV